MRNSLNSFKKGRHSVTWDRMKEHRQYQTLPDPLKRALCERCHNIQNRCNGCHTSHAFNPAEAKEPEACKKCHTGMAGPHDEMYASSIHGTIYATERNSRRAPTCATCHMYKGTHNSSFGVIYDSLGDAVDKNGNPLSQQDQERIRQPLVKEVCHQCHIPDLTLERFELADRVKNEARKLLAEAEKTIRELEAEGILPRGSLWAGGSSMKEPPELRAFIIECFSSIMSTRGREPIIQCRFAHWYGWAHLQMSLIEIKEEARKLKELRKIKK